MTLRAGLASALVTLVLGGIGLGGIDLGGIGTAGADGPDDQFVATLSGNGITGDPARLIETGHGVCDWQNLPHNENPWSPYSKKRMEIIGDLQTQRLSTNQVNQFIRDAIEVYCPERKTW